MFIFIICYTINKHGKYLHLYETSIRRSNIQNIHTFEYKHLNKINNVNLALKYDI